MTFEGTEKKGPEGIVNFLRSLGPMNHVVNANSIDVQPAPLPNVIIIFVNGTVRFGANEPQLFSQSFVLADAGAGQYKVDNCFFRLNNNL